MGWGVLLRRGATILVVLGSVVFAWWEARKASNLQVQELQCSIELDDKTESVDRLKTLLEQREAYIQELEGLLDAGDLFDRVFGGDELYTPGPGLNH